MKFLAYYLPQYHPIPENDKWWGTGFTEWTNVTKAKKLFSWHEQPILPGDLGFYDLRVPEVRQQQANLAKAYGLDGFIYYHYWFGNGRLLLQRPAEEVLASQKPDFPFCFCWANESWKGIWHGVQNSNILIEQTYPGEADIIAHFNYLLPFFKDERYIKVDGKPMFHIYKPYECTTLVQYLKIFNQLAKQNGFPGIYFIASRTNKKFNIEQLMDDENGFSAITGLEVFSKMRYESSYVYRSEIINRLYRYLKSILSNLPGKAGDKFKTEVIDYAAAVNHLVVNLQHKHHYFPVVFPNWDNSARSGYKSMIFKNANPILWKQYLKKVVDSYRTVNANNKFIIIKSWNEWAEGNYLEPDRKYGHAWLEALREVKSTIN